MGPFVGDKLVLEPIFFRHMWDECLSVSDFMTEDEKAYEESRREEVFDEPEFDCTFGVLHHTKNHDRGESLNVS